MGSYAEYQFPNQPVKFVHDNSSIHKARVVTAWFADRRQYEVLPWPAKGADMNPIENVWGDMVCKLKSKQATTQDELGADVSAIWDRLGDKERYWQRLACSMPKRLQMVIEAEGNWNKY